MFNIQGPISVNINLITLNGVHEVLQNTHKTVGEAGGDLLNVWFQSWKSHKRKGHNLCGAPEPSIWEI